MKRILSNSDDKDFFSCTFRPYMRDNLKDFPWVNLPNYIPIITFCLAMIVIGKNFEGQKLPMVYLITALIIVQSASVLILTSYFICNEYNNYLDNQESEPFQPPPIQNYNFLYALTTQLSNLQIYVNLIWLYSWYMAFEKVKLGNDLQRIENSTKTYEIAD